MKKDLCKIMVCLVGAMALGGFNMTDAKAETAETTETAFISNFGEKESNGFITFSINSTNKALQHQYYVKDKKTKANLIGNYQTTYWVYGASGLGFYQSPTNTILRIDSNANFLNGTAEDDHINGSYTYVGDIYYNSVRKGKVSFVTTMNSAGYYTYSTDPEVKI